MVSTKLTTEDQFPSKHKFTTNYGLFNRLGLTGVNGQIDLSYLRLLAPIQNFIKQVIEMSSLSFLSLLLLAGTYT